MTVFRGTAGDDNLTGTSGNDEFILWQGGNDTVDAGAGNDTMRMGNSLTAADQLDGGAGRDAVILNGDYSSGLVLAATTITNVEVLGLVGGHSYNLTTNDGNVAAGQKLIVEANGLGIGDTLTFDGSAETDGRFYVVGGAGDATITGGAQNDIFHLENGGVDTVHGGNGNDAFYTGTSLWSDDTIDGGAGYDKVFAGGDSITFTGTTMQGVEDFVLSGSGLGVATADATVAAGAAMIIDASAVNGFTFDGSAETDGRFDVLGGAGNDTLTGGAKRDVFHLESGGNDTAHGGGGNDTFLLGGALTASDSIDGGAGNDTLELNGDYGGLSFGPNTITNVETLKFDNGHHYHIATNDGNVASGQTLTVDFSAMTSLGIFFDGSAELDGNFRFVFGSPGALDLRGGNGNDIFDATHAGNSLVDLSGGGGDDTFLVGANFDHMLIDSVDGGSGNDTIEFNGDYPSLVEVGVDFLSIETIRFDGGHTYSDVVIGVFGAATIDASQVSTLFHLTFTNGNYTIEVGSGGMSASPYDSSSQDNTFIVTSEASLAASTLDAGNGSDTLELNGDFSGGFTFGATTATNFENITVDAGHNYNLASNDANVAAGATLTVDASALTSSFTLDFSGGAETDGHFAFIGGAGADLLGGGSQSDTFDLSLSDGAFVSGSGGNDTFTVTSAAHLLDDFIDGGTGSDTLVLNGDFSAATAITGSNVVSIEALQLLGAANSYNLTVAGVIGAGTFTVDASAAASLTLDLTAATSSGYIITGSNGGDSIILSGSGANAVTAGLGADQVTCGAAVDTIVTGAVADSTGAGGFDTINAFNFNTDKFDLAGAHTVTAINATLALVDSATFDANLTAASVGFLPDDGVLFVTANAGDLAGHTFIVVDVNNDGLYQAGADYVFDIVNNSTGIPTIGDFI